MVKSKATTPVRAAALAKLNRPRLPAILPRERLFRRLEQLSDRPCTWICAPAGFGKTTLAASYLDAQGIPCLWYQIDEDDADLATFFYYLGGAVVACRDGPPLPLLTPEYQDDIPTFTRRYFQELFQRLSHPFVLLFDDYQRIAAATPFHEVLGETLAQIPIGVRCMVTSREEPPPALARARLNGQLVVIEAEELRLTLAEAQGIAKVHIERCLTEARVQEIYERVQGWAAGLTLLLQRSQPSVTSPAATGILFDYFAAEVLRQADPERQTFLLKTALFPKMTAAMAQRLTGWSRAEEVLNELTRSNYFTFRSESAEPSYQYHDLFRDFLLSRGRDVLSGAECEQDKRRAALILEDVGEISAAVELFQALGDWQHLTRLVCQQAQMLLQQGRHQLLESWLDSFPSSIRDRSPWLLFWQGHCRLHSDPVEARAVFTRAYGQFKRADEVTGVWLTWSAIVDTYALAWDDFRASGSWLSEFEQLRTRYPAFPSADIEARVTFGVFNLLVYARPDYPEFEEWERRITRLMQTDLPTDLYLVPLNTLLHHYIWNIGKHGRAAGVLNTLRAAIADAAHVEPVILCSWHCWEFCYQYWYEGDLTQCLAIAEAGWATAAEHGVGLFKNFLLANFVYANLSAGRLEAGREALQKFKTVLKSFRPLERAHYYYLQGWEAWLSGRLPEALDLLEQTLQITQRCFYHSTGLTHLGLAQIHASLGNRASALRHLAGVRYWVRVVHSKVGAFLRALAAAQFALAWGKQAHGLRLLRRALALGREEGYIFFPFFKPDAVARLCATALEAQIEVEYVQTLIRKRGLLPDLSASTPEGWTWPVKIYTLGHFSLEVDNEPVRFGRKPQHKPLELLKVLVAWGGQEVSQAQLADVLWPTADGDLAQQALMTTLHRLRRLLRHEQALCLREGRLSLDPRYCWVDIWDLERWLGQALAQARQTDEKAAQVDMETLTHHILSAYRGPFLGQDTEAWALPTRKHLHDKYLRGLDGVGTYWERIGSWEKASHCYEQGLEVDVAAERFYQGLLRCYDRLGRRTEAVRIYHRCRDALKMHLRTVPSNETEMLYQQILRG